MWRGRKWDHTRWRKNNTKGSKRKEGKRKRERRQLAKGSLGWVEVGRDNSRDRKDREMSHSVREENGLGRGGEGRRDSSLGQANSRSEPQVGGLG